MNRRRSARRSRTPARRAVAGALLLIACLVIAYTVQTLASPSAPHRVTQAPHSAAPPSSDLAPALARALGRARADAAAEGVTLRVTSGRRTAAHQQQLLDEAIDTYGSRAEAARWVATPDRSAHVSGDAIDVDTERGAPWLAANGARYGLCQTYRNEPWHYELRIRAMDDGCPEPYVDPTHDPRLQS